MTLSTLPAPLVLTFLVAVALSATAQAADAPAPPALTLDGSPKVWIPTVHSEDVTAPTHWVVFRTKEAIDPELITVRVDDRLARVYRAGGPQPCFRATVPGSGTRPSTENPGRPVVTFSTRSNATADVPSAVQDTRTIRARFYSPVALRPIPDCATGDVERFTPTRAFRVGLNALARNDGAKLSEVRVTCQANATVGDTKSCQGTFRLRRGDQTATYRLHRAATFRNTPGSIQYIVRARTKARVTDFPARTFITGFAAPEDT